MAERFVRVGIEIPLSLYANLDKIKNGSAASGRILDAIKKEKTEMEKARTEYDLWRATKTYKNSIYGEMKGRTQTMNPRMIDANYLIKEFTDRAMAARNWKESALNSGNEESAIRADAVLSFLTEVKLTIDNAPTLNDKAYTIGYAAGSREGYKKGIEEARPTGEWKQDINGLHVCSNCHMKYIGMPTINRTLRWCYCPNCGAKMKGDKR